jgi:beta-galactosidase
LPKVAIFYCQTQTEIKVYTNYECVELYNNGALVERQVNNKIFKFNIKIENIHKIVVKAGSHIDESKIIKVSEPNKNYVLMGGRIKNWFDEPGMECPEGYYSIKDTMGEIRQNPAGETIIEKMMTEVREKRGDVAKNVKQSESMIKFMNSMTIEELIKQTGGSITEDMVLKINKALNQVKKVS